MQYNFTFYDFASSCPFVLQIVVKNLFEDFWKSFIPFSRFFFNVNCLLFYSVYRSSFFSMKLMRPINAPVRWWPCWCHKCVSGLRRLEKTWTLVMHTSLGPGAQMLFKQKWRKMDSLLFLFTILVNIVASFMKMSFFNLRVRFLGWSFLVLQCYGIVCNWVPKVIWTRLC